jgi:cytochrome P450
MTRTDRSALPPGPSAPPWLQLLGTWTRPTATLERLRRYGSRVTVRLPFQPPFVMLSDPADIKEVFAAPPEVLHPGEGAWVLEPIIGRNSVILLDEGAHLAQRRLLLPAFHGERMQRLVGVMTELTEREVDAWPVGEPMALHPRLQSLTLEIILQAVFGLERGPRLDALRDALCEVLSFSESPLSVLPVMQRALRWTPTMRAFRAAIARTDGLLFTLIDERRAEASAAADGEAERDDVLAMLIGARHENGSPMSREELRDELMTALVAGHETTASQLAWALERLAREPVVVARLVDELDRGESAYLDATITEILRLRPVLPNAEPRLVKQPVRIGGVEYPPGVVLMASAYLVHHDPAIYPEPYAFRPERFLDASPGSYTWIPFGGGRRRCLGASFALQEMKIVLRAVVGRFALGAAGPTAETTRRRGITFSPRGGATVILTERTPVPGPAVAPLAVPA